VALFRRRSISAAQHRLFGQACVATPPSAGATLAIALLSVTLVGIAAYVVEVPQRTRAVGVLMPSDGLLNIVATDTGRISELNVRDGMTVRKGQVLVRITSDRNAPDRTLLSESQVRSLKAELDLLDRARAHAQLLNAGRESGLRKQLALTEERMARAESERELHLSHVRLLEQSLARLRILADNGSLAEDVLSREKSAVLNAKAIAAGLEGDVLEIHQEHRSMQSELAQLLETSELDNLQQDMKRERLRRELGEAEIEAGRVILAPVAGVVARINTKTGATCRPGQILMTLHDGEGRLEAWLYLPSDKAGQLESGQAVQLRLDAYPHEVFGTVTAIVSEVSSIALLAADLSIPLPIKGPVFEVRAAIADNSIEALGSSWPLSPGTSFKADVIRRQYRLYEWLLRSLWREDEGGPIVVGT
jgi:membrane fusion protein